ncbi:MAG: SusC/RagA family TonB-linked outer membrane protein, partial [Sediminibacterium sp.]|nr:SusC/RagA family TonB-linked outer membrane protein [Sediminibacterium sp.]
MLALTTNAQNKTVTGKVTDSKNGSPLVGATVSTKPSGNATATKSDGSFSLSVKPGVTKLVISFTGYADKEISIDASGVVNLTMEPNAEQLQDVVVVGYGTRKLKDATGSVSSIGAKSFIKGVISSPENLFQGKIAGVTVTTNSGEPGGAINVVIRGTSSIRGNNNPLFVVDGVPLSGGGTTNNSVYGEGGTTARNPLSFLNPNDIENISVLKDASSAAIYGARGANGVILITTKNGRGANSGFNVGYNFSSSNIASRYNLATAQDFVWGVRTALQRSGLSEDNIQTSVSNIDKGYSTDWQDQIFQTGVANNLNISWGKSTKKTSFRLSGSLDDQQGIVKSSGLTRNAIRFNLDHNFTSKFKLNLGVTYSSVKNAYAGISNNAGYQGSLIGAAIAFNPTYPIYNQDGTFYDPNDGNRNPVMILNYFKDNDVVKTLLINAGLTYNINKNLSVTTRVGIEDITTLRQGFADPNINNSAFSGSVTVLGKTYDNSGYNGNGRGIKTNVKASNLVAEYFLTYDKNFGNSNINVIGGFSYQNTTNFANKQIFWGLSDKTSLNTDFSKFKNYTPIYSDNLGDSAKYELQSYYGRINYTISDKYLFTVTVRNDGSSRFGKNNKNGTFPAIAFKWKVLNEKFAEGATKIFDNLDLRLNYGLTGNQEFGSYSSLLIEQRNFNGALNQIQAQNPNIKWEATTTSGIGLDFSFLNGRIRGNIDYYNKVTKDLIFLKPYFKSPYVRF